MGLWKKWDNPKENVIEDALAVFGIDEPKTQEFHDGGRMIVVVTSPGHIESISAWKIQLFTNPARVLGTPDRERICAKGSFRSTFTEILQTAWAMIHKEPERYQYVVWAEIAEYDDGEFVVKLRAVSSDGSALNHSSGVEVSRRKDMITGQYTVGASGPSWVCSSPEEMDRHRALIELAMLYLDYKPPGDETVRSGKKR
jgi:hypothetical protein